MTSNEQHLSHLIDVVALSTQHCERPIQANLVYATPDNFVGQIIDGYTPGLTDFALMTKESALALCKVQNELLKNHQLSLLIYDSYRPKRAVVHFMKWSEQAIKNDHELKRKQIHFPTIDKSELFDLGYVSADSQHCYGHTVDLVLINDQGIEQDLGACFDFMDPLSHWTATAAEIGDKQLKNRHILKAAMESQGFIPYIKEFWHYSFKHKTIQEPINIEITPELRGWNIV